MTGRDHTNVQRERRNQMTDTEPSSSSGSLPFVEQDDHSSNIFVYCWNSHNQKVPQNDCLLLTDIP